MGKKLHFDKAAEKEATDIGAKFMHSSDVVGDMSRAYGRDLSSVRIHTDESAARGAAERGMDAFSTGKDVFFGRGAFDRSDPASRGLLAHELSHSMQQGVGGEGGAMAQSAPMGAAQGGLLDWFRSKFGKKKPEPEPEPDMEISEPTLVSDPTTSGPDGFQLVTDNSSESKLRFRSAQSRAIYQIAKDSSPEQLRTNETLRKLILDDYKENMTARLSDYDDQSYDNMFSAIFRANSIGEMNTYNMLMRANLPKGLISDMTKKHQKTKSADAALDLAGSRIASSPEMMEILSAGMDAFGNSVHFSGEHEDRRSGMLMNSVVLRGIAPEITDKVAKTRETYARMHGGDREKDYGHFVDLVGEARTKGIGKKDLDTSVALQKAVKEGPGMTEGGRRFRDLMNRFWKKR